MNHWIDTRNDKNLVKKNPAGSGQGDFFKERLENIINLSHRLVRLSELIAWDVLEVPLSQHYCMDNGRPGGAIRLMAGVMMLKDIDGQSDESVCERWGENPYWQK